MKAIIDADTCLTCRACVGICPVGALSQLRREISVDMDTCTGCGICKDNCPTRAISLHDISGIPIYDHKTIETPHHLKTEFDIIIAGAGLAGLCTALAAIEKKADLKILVIDKKRVIGEDANSSAGTWNITLDMLPLTEAELDRVLLQEFTALGLGTDVNSTIIDSGSFFLGSIDLPALLKVLARKVKDKGVRIETASYVKSASREEDGFILNIMSKGHIYPVRSHLVVDATGVDTTLSKDIGMHRFWKVENLGVGAEYEMTWKADPKVGWLIPMKYTGLGYAWVFPIGNEMARVGVAGLVEAFKENDLRIQDVLDEFIATNTIIKENVGEDYSRLALKCGAYPISGVAEDIVTDGALRIGDAAAQANPLLGEGIYYCIKNGLFAGELLASVESGSAEELAPYKDFVMSYSQKFEDDKLGFKLDFDTIIKKLNDNPDLLSQKEKRVLFEYMMPVKPDWKTRIMVSKKLLGTGQTLAIFGKVMKRMALG